LLVNKLSIKSKNILEPKRLLLILEIFATKVEIIITRYPRFKVVLDLGKDNITKDYRT